MKHYRRPKNSGFMMFLLCALSFAVLFVGMWALKEMGLPVIEERKGTGREITASRSAGYQK